MERGLYAAASGMIVQMVRTDTIANNLANVDTTGFKKDLSVFRTNYFMNIHRVEDEIRLISKVSVDPRPLIGFMANGSTFERNFIDFSQGALHRTDNPLDVAISGPDFFAVQTPAGILYTRDGSFRRNANGTLVTLNGYPLLNPRNQPILLGDGTVSFGRDGNVFLNGQPVDQLQRVTLPQTLAIQKVGDNLYRYTGTPGPAQGEIEQGFLEASNANAILEIVRLIEAQRAYQASSRALQSQDAAIQLAVTDVGRSAGR